MGLWDLLKRLFSADGQANPYAPPGRAERTAPARAGKPARFGMEDLLARLRLSEDAARAVVVSYNRFTIPKRSGGQRTIDSPCDSLKALQRTILARVLGRLASHPAATGFERGRSIVTNAAPHVGAAVVVRMDLHDFFPSTTSERVREFFQAVGWDRPAAERLTEWCTLDGRLPQGAPTSPRLSNLVNYALDARLTGLARRIGAAYTRYADDITFSFAQDARGPVAAAIRGVKGICREYGYRLHQKRKLIIRRRHQCQRVTGLVVNEKVALSRATRRRLRAIEHHVRTGRPATLTPRQLQGWQALMAMVAAQAPARER